MEIASFFKNEYIPKREEIKPISETTNSISLNIQKINEIFFNIQNIINISLVYLKII